jgi:hypothetical protein
MKIMPSKKSNSVSLKKMPDNQQERLKTVGWIVGYTDGEGCFSVTIIKNKRTKFGWQVFPEFVITQGEKSFDSLVLIKDFFGCGNIFVNHRRDNHKENIWRYCVRSINDLNEIIIPFFEKNSLKTEKKDNFLLFSKIIKIMIKKEHYQLRGIKKIAKIIQKLNRKYPSKFLESSETKRQIPK